MGNNDRKQLLKRMALIKITINCMNLIIVSHYASSWLDFNKFSETYFHVDPMKYTKDTFQKKAQGYKKQV